jgi:chemotaxis protein methyltransferase WspC
MTSLTAFGDLLKQSIGLDAGSIGVSAIERAVQTRQLACEGCDRAAYWRRLQGNAAELQALIEAVVIPETWFFRDGEALAAVARMAREQWLGAPETAVIRLLSVPSSTGEEPYSMAMALLDAGVPAERFRIDAVDVSARVLVCAEQATYGRNSFRGRDLTFRDRYFEPGAHGHRLKDSVRRQVHFQQGNILAWDFLMGGEPYDAVFCRNLLIYFDRETQDRAIFVLKRLLKKSGVLFVAPSETGMLLNHDFESAKVPLAFAFHKRAAAAGRAPKPPRLRPAHRPPVAASRPALSEAEGPALSKAEGPALSEAEGPAAAPSQAAKVALDEAVRLADLGRVAEAAACCDDQFLQHGPSAGLFHLKGLLSESVGDSLGACSFYRKALYLDPAHHDTLIHLALLVEQQGDVPGAKVLKDRARRHDKTRSAASRTSR